MTLRESDRALGQETPPERSANWLRFMEWVRALRKPRTNGLPGPWTGLVMFCFSMLFTVVAIIYTRKVLA
jgi:hypothetical protein